VKENIKIKAKINWRKELSFVPGYILISFWVLLTFYLISWIVFASFSTTREIFSGQLFQFASGFHISNYLKVWRAHMVSTYFFNSLIYSVSACTIIILIAAPAAYALARFKFRFNKLLQNMFVAAMGIPVIMIIMPLFSLATTLDMTNSRFTLIFLYVCMYEYSLYYIFSIGILLKPISKLRRSRLYRWMRPNKNVLEHYVSAFTTGSNYSDYFQFYNNME